MFLDEEMYTAPAFYLTLFLSNFNPIKVKFKHSFRDIAPPVFRAELFLKLVSLMVMFII